MAVTHFIFLRHAQATHNVAASLVGDRAYIDAAHRDAALTVEGHAQVLQAQRENIGATAPDVTYCSPLQRCRHTLLGVFPAAASGEVRVDDRLMEPQSHVCNHRAEKAELARDCPDTWMLDGVSDTNPKDATDSIAARICDFTADVLTRHAGQRVLIVSHFTWIQTWFRIFKHETVAPRNCGVLLATMSRLSD